MLFFLLATWVLWVWATPDLFHALLDVKNERQWALQVGKRQVELVDIFPLFDRSCNELKMFRTRVDG